MFRAHRSVLSPVQKRIARDLRQDGIAVAHLDEFFARPDMRARFDAYVRERMAHAEVKTHKKFLRNLLDAIPTIDNKNPFIFFALSDHILATVNEYMQMCAYFYYLTLNITSPVPAGTEAVQSQRWHSDPEDKKMCKVFLYLTDVDEGSGPFTYVRGTHYGGRWRHLFHENLPHGCLPPTRPIEELVPASDIIRFTGKAGTIIFCDTSGYHRGGYATTNERMMLTLGYCSAAGPYPVRFRLSQGFDRELDRMGLSAAARYALSFSRGPVTRYMFKMIKPNFKYGA